jgi:hypothetical protein
MERVRKVCNVRKMRKVLTESVFGKVNIVSEYTSVHSPTHETNESL